MKKLIAFAGLILALGMSTSAIAQTATGNVNITATVNTTCTIATVAPADLDFSSVGNASLISTAAQTANFGTADCNAPATIALTTTNGAATTNSGAVAGGGYANFFDYTATTTWGGATVTLDTSSVGPAGAATQTTAAPNNGNLSVTVTPAPGSNLAAGTYLDVLTVTLTPN